MSWLEKILPPKITSQDASTAKRSVVPEGVWSKCQSCETVLYGRDLDANQQVCPHCGFHMRMSARARLDAFLDPDGRLDIGANVLPMDPLKFKDSKKYTDRLKEAEKNSDSTEALLVQAGRVLGMPVVAAAFEFDFMGGSMGSVVGERFCRGVEHALQLRCGFVCFTATGGARMQEGLLSLMQMAKTNAALTLLAAENLPFISVLTDPTMGGVSASFAFLGDVVLSEPKALVGFAGPRVIENTVRQVLPEGFQRAEFLLEKGAIDAIVDRRQLREEIARLLALLQRQPLELSAA